MSEKLDFSATFTKGSLINKDGDFQLNPDKYEVIGLYFSAHWCPPCRAFTPVLSNLYNNRSDEDGKKLLIIFVSSDRDEASFKEYFKTMPWVAMNFGDRDKKEKLSYNYKVRGIPTLVLLDKNGKTITKDGRNIASEMETAGDLVRWTREPRISDFRATFTKEPLINKDGDFQLNPDKYEVIGLYFSAHWCPPCRAFTPVLSNLYNKRSDEDGEKLLIIFVSFDRDEASFKEHFKTMPWVAMNFDSDKKMVLQQELAKHYEVSDIPTLVLLDKNGKTITKGGRYIASEMETADDIVRWARKPIISFTRKPLINKDGDFQLNPEKYEVIGLYFSAHWVPSCSDFTPVLSNLYNNRSDEDGEKLLIIFVSLDDRDEASFKEHFKTMPWVAMNFGNAEKKRWLVDHYEVSDLPTLVLLDKNGKTITKNGRSVVTKMKTAGDLVRWSREQRKS